MRKFATISDPLGGVEYHSSLAAALIRHTAHCVTSTPFLLRYTWAKCDKANR